MTDCRLLARMKAKLAQVITGLGSSQELINSEYTHGVVNGFSEELVSESTKSSVITLGKPTQTISSVCSFL